ncbi:hypothetical protein THOE12_10232 [Vibrio rotiferianus]|nr:hypothetical protein THOE12_10232 [Vibrio rotiferianus]
MLRHFYLKRSLLTLVEVEAQIMDLLSGSRVSKFVVDHSLTEGLRTSLPRCDERNE